MLKAILDQAAYDALPEALKGFYKDVNGKFTLQVESVGGLALEDTKGLKDALAKERGNASKLAEQLKKFEGIEDVDELKSAKEQLEKLKDATPKDKLDELLKDRETKLRKQFETEKAKIEEANKGLTSELEKVLITNAATTALTEAGGKVGLLLPHVKTRIRLKKTDTGYVPEVVDENGNPRVGDSSGGAMSIKQLVEEFKQHQDFSVAFAASGAAGTGAGGGTGGSGGGAGAGAGGGNGGSTRVIGRGAIQTASLEDLASGKVTVASGQ